MSVEPIELMSEVWTGWQGHVIHDAFPLGRFLGCSDHGGVFLTKSATLGTSDLAIKLVPTDRVLAESQLPLWERAGGIIHPHLLRLLQWGECQLDGLPYLYVVMEYADQTLAQVLQRRALTDDEAREMLRPTLDALAFMHGQNLVHGQLKPANILVVGDQLKLASDTIRRVGEGTMSARAPTGYDPPEARYGGNSTAGDIWSLGVCLFEALTCRAPSRWGERSETVTLPADFSPAFRDVVARCLNPNPQNRPSATELVAWAGGQAAISVPEATIQPAAIKALQSTTLEPPPPRITPPPAAREAVMPVPSLARSPKPRTLLAAVLGAVVILALCWTGVRLVRSHGTAAPPPPALEGSLSQPPDAGAPMAADVPNPVAKVLPPKSGPGDPVTSTSELHEVIPEVPQSARRSIRGHIKVWVRIIVDPDGSVIAATADRSGRSRYLLRLAIEAARKWTFPTIDTQSRRVMQIRFDFGRDETTGRAVTLH
jgi:TonB family protein